MQNRNKEPKYSQEEILDGFRDGINRVVEQVYKENYPAVRAFVLKNSGDENEARDVYQEAVIAAWLNVKEGRFTIQTGGGIGAYIFRIAKNKWLDKLKSKQVKSTVRLTFVSDDGESETELKERKDLERRIEEMEVLFAGLGDKCRAILNRFYYRKMSLEEIGEELNHDASSLRTMKYRCMMQLRKLHLQNKGDEKNENEPR